MNNQVNEYTKLIKSNTKVLRSNYKVKNLGIFGSVVRNEQTEKSDVDILIEFSESVGLFHFIKLKNFLSTILNHKVDLIQKGALDRNQKKRPGMKERVLKEMIPIL
ncbi:MAG: nucleotidyltransferase family protein [Elusimicrobiota bacterium]